VARKASDEELLAGALHARSERWLELEGVFTILGFGDAELAGELDWEPGSARCTCGGWATARYGVPTSR